LNGRPATTLRPLPLGVVCATLAIAGCGDSGSDLFAITFRNDTGRDVQLKLCDDDVCRRFDYSDRLRPGGTVTENISTDNVFTRWAVTDRSGRSLGCLPFSFAGAYRNATVRLTQMVPCPGQRPLPLASGSPTR
jgi:hypothetical protein